MANKTLFKSPIGKLIPATDAINEERAPAYALSPQAQLESIIGSASINDDQDRPNEITSLGSSEISVPGLLSSDLTC
jgi:hypothetical protein